MAQTTVFEILYKLKDNASRQFVSASQKITGSADKTTKSVAKTGGSFNNLGKAIKAFIALAAVRQLALWMKETVRLAAEQETAINKLNAALRSTGSYTPEASKQLQRFAKDMQAVTTVGDEVTLSVLGTLQTLTKLDTEGLQKAAQATIGLSKVLGIELKAAALIVGKSIGSSTNALIRYGVQLDTQASQQDKVNQLMKTTASMFEIAKAETDTYAGAVIQLRNAYGDWREEIGKTITDSGSLKELIKGLTELFGESTQSMQDSTLGMAETFNNVFVGLARTIQGLVNVVNAADLAIKKFTEVKIAIDTKNVVADIEKYQNAIEELQGTLDQTRRYPHRGLLGTPLMIKGRAITDEMFEDLKRIGILDPFGKDKQKAIDYFHKQIVALNPDIMNMVDALEHQSDVVDNAWENLIKTNEAFNEMINNMRNAKRGASELSDTIKNDLDDSTSDLTKTLKDNISTWEEFFKIQAAELAGGYFGLNKQMQDLLKPVNYKKLGYGFAPSNIKRKFEESMKALRGEEGGTIDVPIKPDLDINTLSIQLANAVSIAWQSGNVKQSITNTLMAASQFAGQLGWTAANPVTAGIALVSTLFDFFGGGNRLPTPTQPVDVRIVEISSNAATALLGITERRLYAATSAVSRFDFRRETRMLA